MSDPTQVCSIAICHNLLLLLLFLLLLLLIILLYYYLSYVVSHILDAIV